MLCTVTIFHLVVGDDFNLRGSVFGRAETNPPLAVDANRVGPVSVAAKRFEAQRARDAKVGQVPGGCDTYQRRFRPFSQVRREPSVTFSVEWPLGSLVLEVSHDGIVTRRVMRYSHGPVRSGGCGGEH